MLWNVVEILNCRFCPGGHIKTSEGNVSRWFMILLKPAHRIFVSGKHGGADDAGILTQFSGHDAAAIKGRWDRPVAGLLPDRFDQDFARGHYSSAHDDHL